MCFFLWMKVGWTFKIKSAACQKNLFLGLCPRLLGRFSASYGNACLVWRKWRDMNNVLFLRCIGDTWVCLQGYSAAKTIAKKKKQNLLPRAVLRIFVCDFSSKSEQWHERKKKSFHSRWHIVSISQLDRKWKDFRSLFDWNVHRVKHQR